MSDKISIFEYLKESNDKNLFIKSSSFSSFLKELAKKYNKFLEEGNEKEYSFFLIKKNSNADFVIVRFLILVKKHLGEKYVLEIYKILTENILLIRDFLIKNKIDERKITKSFIETLKKQKNFSLLDSGDFKAEDVLFLKIEKEIDKEEIKKEESTENNKEIRNDKEKIIKKDFEIREKEFIIYNEEGKVIKRLSPFLTKSDRKIPFIGPYIEENNEYFYLGEYFFGEKIKIDNKLMENNKKIKRIILELIKKIKGEIL